MQQNLIDAARAVGTKPVTGRYFLCMCSKCGWLGSSEECRLLEDPIFGDGEYFCAVCGASEPDEVDAAEAFNAILAGTASRHPDDVAVDRFALAMKAKLADARAKGRSGWDDPARCSVEFLAQLLVGHISKDNAGNFEDVANLAMMLHQRGADPSVLAEAAGAKMGGEPAGPGLFALLYRDNWDGQDDTYHLLAERKNGKWYAEDSGKELLQYEGDAILRVWPLTDTAVGPFATARAIEAAAAAIYLADSSDYLGALWTVLRWLSPDIAALMEKDERAAWGLACTRLTAEANQERTSNANH